MYGHLSRLGYPYCRTAARFGAAGVRIHRGGIPSSPSTNNAPVGFRLLGALVDPALQRRGGKSARAADMNRGDRPFHDELVGLRPTQRQHARGVVDLEQSLVHDWTSWW